MLGWPRSCREPDLVHRGQAALGFLERLRAVRVEPAHVGQLEGHALEAVDQEILPGSGEACFSSANADRGQAIALRGPNPVALPELLLAGGYPAPDPDAPTAALGLKPLTAYYRL